MSKNNMILILVFSILTFLSSITCAILIFSNETARTNINSNKILANVHNNKSTTIIYNENNSFTIENLNPGNSITKTFEITNNNSDNITYSIIWYDIETTWHTANEYGITHPEEFVYTLSCSNGEKMDNIEMPPKGSLSSIMDNITLETNKTNRCTLTMTFIARDNEEQLYNMNKTFKGTYKVVIEK